jgi:nicotinate-nucleotide pyrophosphorylase (carboxylating)
VVCGMSAPDLDAFLFAALREDAPFGDKTTESLGLQGSGEGILLAKEPFVVCGLPAALRTFELADSACAGEVLFEEGAVAKAGDFIGRVRGPYCAILLAERTALNLLQRLCGIATFARQAAEAAAPYGAKVLDTRKTTPGLRLLEKYAVRTGGALNHRMGLSDAILIKDNHLAVAGSIAAAVAACRARAGALWKVEVEVKNLVEFREALAAGAEVVLLDNMSDAEIEACVAERPPGVLLEASGGMTLERLPRVCALGVDLISMGALTHSVRASDVSLEILPAP